MLTINFIILTIAIFASKLHIDRKTNLAIAILKEYHPPTLSKPSSPSPVIHKINTISKGCLPNTGEFNYYLLLFSDLSAYLH